MKLSKKFLISTILISACAFTFAQTSQVQSENSYDEVETSVESDYLNDLVGESISAMADADDLDTKLQALSAVTQAIESGNRSQAVLDSLDKLAGEGITSEVRKRGRKMNEFPQIRREACLVLGQVPTEHSKNTLVRIAREDKEPMVVSAAIKALGEIAEEVGCVDEAVDAICYFNAKKNVMNPTSSLAHEVLFALEKLGPSATNRKQIIDTIAVIASNYNYNTAVRLKAISLLTEMANANVSSDSGEDEVVEVSEK